MAIAGMDVSQVLHRQPDLEFDGYLSRPDCPGHLCDCRIWLPKDASEDACIEIEVPLSAEAPFYPGPGPLILLGKLGLHGEVAISGVWIKAGPSQRWPARKAGGSPVVDFSIVCRLFQQGCRGLVCDAAGKSVETERR